MIPSELIPCITVDKLFSTLTICPAVSSMLMVAEPVIETPLLVENVTDEKYLSVSIRNQKSARPLYITSLGDRKP